MPNPPPTQLTAGHRQLHALLSRLGLICEDEVQVGRYVVDVYCRDYHLAFEFDGELHRRPQQRKHDNERDTWLLQVAGVPVFRVGNLLLRDRTLGARIETWVEEQCETLAERLRKGELWPRISLV